MNVHTGSSELQRDLSLAHNGVGTRRLGILITLVVAVAVSGCGAPATVQTSSTGSTTAGTLPPPTTDTTLSPSTTSSGVGQSSTESCVDARPVADVLLSLVRWETGAWRGIAGGRVSGNEAVALLDEFTEDFTTVAESLSTLSPEDPELSQIVSGHRDLLTALLEQFELLRQGYSQGATDPLESMQEDEMWTIAVMFETSAVGLIEWLETNCPDLADEVVAEVDRLES